MERIVKSKHVILSLILSALCFFSFAEEFSYEGKSCKINVIYSETSYPGEAFWIRLLVDSHKKNKTYSFTAKAELKGDKVLSTSQFYSLNPGKKMKNVSELLTGLPTWSTTKPQENTVIAVTFKYNDEEESFEIPVTYTEKEYLPIFTKVLVFGYPLGTSMYDNLSGFDGYISSVQKIRYNKNMYNLDIIAMPGSSGACLIDKNTMKVIGIVNGRTGDDKHGIPFGCPIQEIWKLVNGGDDNE